MKRKQTRHVCFHRFTLLHCSMFSSVSRTGCFEQGVHKLDPLVNSEHWQDLAYFPCVWICVFCTWSTNSICVFTFFPWSTNSICAFVFLPWSTIGIVYLYFAPGQLLVFVHLYFAPGQLPEFEYVLFWKKEPTFRPLPLSTSPCPQPPDCRSRLWKYFSLYQIIFLFLS